MNRFLDTRKLLSYFIDKHFPWKKKFHVISSVCFKACHKESEVPVLVTDGLCPGTCYHWIDLIVLPLQTQSCDIYTTNHCCAGHTMQLCLIKLIRNHCFHFLHFYSVTRKFIYRYMFLQYYWIVLYIIKKIACIQCSHHVFMLVNVVPIIVRSNAAQLLIFFELLL